MTFSSCPARNAVVKTPGFRRASAGGDHRPEESAKKFAKTCCMVSTCFNLSIWSCLHGDLRISIPCFTCFLWESDTPDSETRKRMKREVPILLRIRGTMDRAKEAPSDMPMTEMRLSSTQTRLPWRF